MKKILFSIMFFISIFIISGCSQKRITPVISNQEGVYLTAKEGEYTYTLTNQRIYNKLKKQVGINILLDIVDEHLMKTIKKDGVSYWDGVTVSEIEETLEKDIFPNGTDTLTEEEANRQRNDYLQDLFISYGLVDEEDVFNYYHLIIAKEAYTKDELAKKYEEEDFKSSEYQTYFDNNYQKEYYAIIVGYDTIKSYQDALAQLGINISGDNEWVKNDGGAALSETEIVKAFVDLYNMNNSFRKEGYPNETLSLNQGIEYDLADGHIVFNLDKIDMLHYTSKEITALQAEVRDLLDKKMSSYPENDNWYTKKPLAYKSGSRQVFVLKIGEKAYDLEEVKPTIKEKLLENKLTNQQVTSTFANARAEKGLVIYDEVLENKYRESIASFIEHKVETKGHESLVAALDDLDISADELFAKMDENYGISIAAGEINYLRFLYNDKYNKIYDIKTKTVINNEKWAAIKQDVADEKKSFNDNLYAEYGFPKSIGWGTFLADFYDVENEEELSYYYIYQDAKRDYSLSLGDLTDLDEDSELWQFYLRNMEGIADKFFNVSGIQLVISVQDASGIVIDPKDWTNIHTDYAREFYQAIMEYLEEEPGTYLKKMQAIADAYQKAPRFLPGREQTANAQPVIEGINYKFKNIEISKYKTAGLLLRFQDMGTFKNGQQPEELDREIHEIWTSDPASETPQLVAFDAEEGNYIITPRGYHIYVNIKSIDIPKWKYELKAGDDPELLILPSLMNIKIYIKDANDKILKTDIKTAITTYYQPIYTELISERHVTLNTFSEMGEFQYQFTHSSYTLSNFLHYLDIQVQKAKENLKYT